MNLNESIENTASVKCPSCGMFAFNSEIVCSQCNYPLKGTEKDQKDFLFHQDLRSSDLYHLTNELKKARNRLYFIAGIFVFSGFIMYATNQSSPDAVTTLILNLIIAIVFVGLGGYCEKRPVLCILTGLVLFAVIVIGNAILDPASIVRGIIFKVAAIVLLINGLTSAREVEKIRDQYPSL